MTHDPSESESLANDRPRGGRGLLILGLAGACALGVTAGLWARPVPDDGKIKPMKAQIAAEARPRLEIVVDDGPAPIGQPIDVLPAAAADASPASVPPPVFIQPEPEPIAPVRPPAGLVRVQAVVPAEAPPAPVVAPPRVEPKAKPVKVKAEKPAKLVKAKAEKPKARKEPARKVAEKARPSKTKLAKAKTRKSVEVAEAPARKKGALRRFEHALAKIVPHRAAKVQVADTRPAPSKKKAQRPLRGGGPMRVASNSRCVSPDPGAAIVCADPALSSADKRLSRAYQEAEAAGVSAVQLKRQQQRWLQARSAAAREAPWAVHDVYLSRIAELNDQARDARGGGW